MSSSCEGKQNEFTFADKMVLILITIRWILTPAATDIALQSDQRWMDLKKASLEPNPYT